MGEKLKVQKPLVILHGDEMAQIAFERILEQFVTSKLDIDLVEVDYRRKSASPATVLSSARPFQPLKPTVWVSRMLV